VSVRLQKYDCYEKRRKIIKLSARNILKGKVVKVVKGAVNSEVIIELPGGEKLVSIITNASVASLDSKKVRMHTQLSKHPALWLL
jgi:molybdopterin-binding protein